MYTYHRKKTSLNGTWSFYADPMRRGMRQTWWRNKRAADALFPCYDEGATTVTVPHDWNAQDERLAYYEGDAWYMRTFDRPASMETGRTFLCFGGANYYCKAYLNGKLVGEHSGGFTAFSFEVTDLLLPHNELWVLVNNTRTEDRIPGMIYDWWNDGGLLREVSLVHTPAAYIADFAVTTKLQGDQAALTFHASVAGDYEGSCRVTVAELGIAEQMRPAGDGYRCTVPVPREEIALWDCANPKRYRVAFAIDGDSIWDDVGLRELTWDSERLYLNGAPVFLKGINCHEAYKEDGQAENHTYIDELFDHFTDLGVNFIRAAHYPHCEYFVRKAEERGLLLLSEIPVYWYMEWEKSDLLSRAQQYLREMVSRDKNRASVAIWSVGNVMADDGRQADAIGALARYAKTLDGTRPVTYVCSTRTRRPDGTYCLKMPALLYADLDIISVNTYAGLLEHDPSETGDTVRAYRALGKPVLVTECGAASNRGQETGPDDAFSEERHVHLLSRQVTALEGLVCGVSPWHFCDMRTPLFFNQGAVGECRYGITDMAWRPKKAYAWLKEYYKTH